MAEVGGVLVELGQDGNHGCLSLDSVLSSCFDEEMKIAKDN